MVVNSTLAVRPATPGMETAARNVPPDGGGTPAARGGGGAALFKHPGIQYACGTMDASCSDEQLMLKYRDGDAAAFEILYLRHKGPLFRYLRRQCGNAATCEELFQDVWMKIIQARERYTVQAKFTTYLYHIAHNRLIDFYRRNSKGLPASYDQEPPDMDSLPADDGREPERQAHNEKTLEQLERLVDELPEAQREAFLMREQAGMSLDEIAEATGVNRETAKSRLRYAVAKLRQGMSRLS